MEHTLVYFTETLPRLIRQRGEITCCYLFVKALLSWNVGSHGARSQTWLTLRAQKTHTELKRSASTYLEFPSKNFKMTSLIPLRQFQGLIANFIDCNSHCFFFLLFYLSISFSILTP